MSPPSPPLTNDFVASILLREAQTRQSRASKEGVYAFLSEPDGTTIGSSAGRRKHNGPKPNARFLKNLVREVDSHNTALLEREAEESSKRLRQLEGERLEERRSGRGAGHAGRSRSIDRGLEDGEVDVKAARRERIRARMQERGLKVEGIGMGLAREKSNRRRRDDDGDNERRRGEGREKDRRRARSRTRSRSPSRSKSTRVSSSKRLSRSPSIGVTSPMPVVRTRGRGRTGASQIDAHFDASYNPTVDILPDPTPDNPSATWDTAVAAYRDRARFKQLGMEQLKESGLYGEEELKRWEKGVEKEEGDYKWAKKGEGREWDRGKVLDKEGKGWNVMPGWTKDDLDY
ncbi:hypothetical protein BJ508DRAFT_413250 [Ascobolus immersus RN42]|uniref:Uncharacterized protein n=1 Tax=Ascobolus immersus RN42 TaxID=1160509 RepID=A0A3N4IH97_ASCIM|nr:hypothetical protein BJ508DRAFT_413250 [Ascobolus immersus RN42]